MRYYAFKNNLLLHQNQLNIMELGSKDLMMKQDLQKKKIKKNR